MTATPRLPNFFIAGSPNAGTTSLFFYLRQHPAVYMSPEKEPNYFGISESDSPTHLTWDGYLDLFRGVRDETAIGEASVHYLLMPAAAREIWTRVPEARLIFVLRHPAETQFTRYLRILWREPELSFREWFTSAVEGRARWAQALTAGNYATNLQRFFDLFPRERIQVHLYDDYRVDERAVARSIFAFLGVDPDYPIDVSRRHNTTVVPRFAALERWRRRMFGSVRFLPLIPPGVRGMARRAFLRELPKRTMDAADRAFVIDYYRSEIQRAGDLIGRDLSAWLR